MHINDMPNTMATEGMFMNGMKLPLIPTTTIRRTLIIVPIIPDISIVWKYRKLAFPKLTLTWKILL
jgi:hypothetical protein